MPKRRSIVQRQPAGRVFVSPRPRKGRADQPPVLWAVQREDLADEIGDVRAQLEGKAKKEYETRKLLALGARKEKGQKMPLRMLQGIRKKSAKREAAQRELERQAGIVTANTPKAGKRKKR